MVSRREPLVAIGVVVVGALGLLSGGCGGQQRTYEVSGTVTFDGAPVEKGEISFVPLDAGRAPSAGVIAGGTFHVRATAGPKRVEIRAARPLPAKRQSEPEMGPLYEDYLPAQFNSASKLTADVLPDTANEFHFDLVGG